MVLVKKGTFMMGSSEDEVGRFQDEDFHEVTIENDFWIGKFPVTQREYEDVMDFNPSRSVGKNKPVDNVTWDDAISYCEKLTSSTGYIHRLPTEEEWEFATRGGNKSKGYLYSGSDNIDDVAWYNCDDVHNVGLKKPNELGIYDMSGNIWEWCLDQYPSFRILRGGGWYSNATFCRSAYRNWNPMLVSWFKYGFRIVKEL